VNKLLTICDRVMYGALLGLVFVLPYSLALIEVCQVMMMVAWVCKRFLLCKTPVRLGGRPPWFNFTSRSMILSLIAIALLIVLTIPFSHYPALCTRKFFGRFLQQIFLMYVVTEIVDSRKRLYSVLSVLLLTLFIVIVDVIVQYACGKDIFHHASLIYGRVSGPMGHPNDLGTLLVTVLPVVLTLSIICRKGIPILPLCKPTCRSVSWAIAVLFLLLVGALVLTASRGAWVAFAVSAIALGACLKSRKSMIAIFLISVVLLGIFSVHFLNTRTDLNNAPKKEGGCNALALFFNPSDRGLFWNAAAGIIKEHPWFGCGYSAYGHTLHDLHVGHEEYPHNSFLQITAELGFIGLILYGWFFTALCLQIKNVLRAISFERDLFLLGCGITAGILAWMVHSLVDTAWASLQLSVLWWLFIGILLSMKLLLSNQNAPVRRGLS
jgi:putative inorganic carbon (HCO3(-)) transporter